jgi:serine/threonine protein kinase
VSPLDHGGSRATKIPPLQSGEAKALFPVFEVHRTASSTLCYVFEYMPNGSIHDLLHARSLKRLPPPLPATDIQSLVRQILAGLAYLHQYQSSCSTNLICKVADFSLARCCATEAHDPVTSYVSTPWYRAPEVLYRRERTVVP